MTGASKAVDFLIEAGADTTAQNTRGETPYDVALRFNRLSLMEKLQTPAMGVERAMVDQKVHDMIDANQKKQLIKLVSEGSDMSVLDTRGRSVLGHAVDNKNYPLL